MLFRWDPYRPGVLFYRDSSDAREKAVQLYKVDGSLVRAVSPLTDLADPKLRAVYIWQAATAPSGWLGVLAVLDHKVRAVSHAILLYDPQGVLRKVWDMYPYHHHAIAIDQLNNVYAFGHRLDDHKPRDYPILIEYSPDGRVARTLMNGDAFPGGFGIDALLDAGVHEMWIHEQTLLLFVGPTRQLLAFDLASATRVRSIDVGRTLGEVAAACGASGAYPSSWGSVRDGPVVQVRIWRDTPRRIRSWLIVAVMPGGQWRPVSRVYDTPRTHFLGPVDRMGFVALRVETGSFTVVHLPFEAGDQDPRSDTDARTGRFRQALFWQR